MEIADALYGVSMRGRRHHHGDQPADAGVGLSRDVDLPETSACATHASVGDRAGHPGARRAPDLHGRLRRAGGGGTGDPVDVRAAPARAGRRAGRPPGSGSPRSARPGAGPRTRTSPGRWTGRGRTATRGPGVYCVIDAGALVELLLRTLRAASVQAAVDDRRLVAPGGDRRGDPVRAARAGAQPNDHAPPAPRRPSTTCGQPRSSGTRWSRCWSAPGPCATSCTRTTRSTSRSPSSWTARWSPPTTGSRPRGCRPTSSTPDPAGGGSRAGPGAAAPAAGRPPPTLGDWAAWSS